MDGSPAIGRVAEIVIAVERRIMMVRFGGRRAFDVCRNSPVHAQYGHAVRLGLTEMEVDLSGPKAGGLDRVLVQDLPNQDLGYEGSHLQRHDGRYYLFTCHFARGHRKTEDCFIADSLDGEFRGRCILDDDLGYHDQGVAQGGMVDTPDGQWYAFMFQDRGALGRTPVLMPMAHGRVHRPSVRTDPPPSRSAAVRCCRER